mmetsp:Transcript_63592/g.169852  ORF Transcript_63592/g.169852 Transcript_63592/m.169852 type:complete len:208 (+) Transcript_63592:132-755(+)
MGTHIQARARGVAVRASWPASWHRSHRSTSEPVSTPPPARSPTPPPRGTGRGGPWQATASSGGSGAAPPRWPFGPPRSTAARLAARARLPLSATRCARARPEARQLPDAAVREGHARARPARRGGQSGAGRGARRPGPARAPRLPSLRPRHPRRQRGTAGHGHCARGTPEGGRGGDNRGGGAPQLRRCQATPRQRSSRARAATPRRQ